MTHEEKIKEITVIENEQKVLLKRAKALSKKPPAKKLITTLSRSFEWVNIFIKIRELEAQKYMIASQPILKEGQKTQSGIAFLKQNNEYQEIHKKESVIQSKRK